jgi:UPF0271 protein
MNPIINLNADLGESLGAWTMGDDAAMLGIVASANIACGYHAGDPLVMKRTVRTALASAVSLGAHPAYPDLQGFGRRRMEVTGEELAAMLIYQTGALMAIAQSEGGRVTHVKPHGALSNVACANLEVAHTIAQAVRRLDPTLILLAPAASCLAQAGAEAGLRVALEIFADRAYQDDGQLAPRRLPGAVIHDIDEAVAHVRRMLDAKAIVSLSGKRLPTRIDSICVHGDGKEAVRTARAVREALTAEGYRIAPLTDMDFA